MPTVSCADCGFLSMRKDRSRKIVDAEAEMRRTGGGLPQPGNTPVYDGLVFCFVQAHDLIDETGSNPGTAERKSAIQRGRNCDSFTQWKQGFTPKEHLEMNLLEEQRRWQHAESAAQRQWQADQAALSDKRQRQALIVAIIAAFIGGAATMGAVWFTKWLG